MKLTTDSLINLLIELYETKEQKHSFLQTLLLQKNIPQTVMAESIIHITVKVLPYFV